MSASTSPGERLCALVHAGLGLQTRLHRLKAELSSPGAKPSFFKDAELDKVRKALEKHFPKRDAAAKEKGWEKLHDAPRARVFVSELSAGYETLKDCMKFRDAVLPALRSGASAIVRDPHKTSRPPEEQFWPAAASRAFLDLISIYARIACQIERLGPECRAYIAGFNTAFFAINNADEEEYQALSQYMKTFEDGQMSQSHETSPILRLVAQEIMENGETIIDTVSYLMETVRPWFLPTASGNAQVWQTLTYAGCTFSEPAAAPADVTKCAPICYRERARGWILWCFLACPAALASARARYSEHARHDTLLKAVLVETVAETIFRDDVIRVHEEFVELFSWFPGKGANQGVKEAFEEFFVASKNAKKFVRDCSIDCINKAALVHRERRIILAQLLLNATYQLQSQPALMGPKGAAAVALLSAARDEAYWYFTHLGQQPPKMQSGGLGIGFFGGNDNAKYVREDWMDGPRVGVLISCYARLYDQVRSLWWIFERYLFETLRGPDAFECQSRGLTDHFQMLQNLTSPSPTSDISNLLHNALLLELRFETTPRPATASPFSSSSSYGDFFLPRMFFHLQMLGEGYVGGNGEDESGGYTDPVALRRFASLGVIVFFDHEVQETFRETLASQPRHATGFLDVLSSVQDVLHEYCPEEVAWLGERSPFIADQMLRRIQEHLAQSLDELAIKRSELDGQTDPIRVAERISRQRERRMAKRNAGAKEREESGLTRLDRRPGFESRPSGRADVSELDAAQKAVRGIVASLGRRANNTILIWNRGYSLREFLRESLVTWLERRLRSKCAGGPTIPRPSIILEQGVQAFDVVRFACDHGGFDAAHFVRQVWVRETSGEHGTVVDLISQWLLKFLDNTFDAPGSTIVFSSLTDGFVRATELESSEFSSGPPSPGGSLRAEMWLDQVEMNSMAAFLGRRGVNAIQRHLKAFVTEKLVNIKRWLFEDEGAIAALKRMTIPGEPGCVRASRAIKNSELVVLSLRSIGAAGKLISMLVKGLLHTSPLASMSDLAAQRHLDSLVDVESAPVLWSGSSHAVAASFCSGDFWKRADFILRLDAHANNAHLVADALVSLLKKSQEPKQLRLREVEALASMSTVLLEMKREQADEFKEWPLRGMTLFLEKFVQASSTLSASDMDSVAPFPLRHAAVLDRFLLRIYGADQGLSADDFGKRVIESNKQIAEDDAAEQADDGQAKKN